jgi:hypothetical protein
MSADFMIPSALGHTVLRANLIDATTCTGGGITATGNAPVLALCRRLVEAGHDPSARL